MAVVATMRDEKQVWDNQQAHVQEGLWLIRGGTVVLGPCRAFCYDLAGRRESLRGYRKLVEPENLQSSSHTYGPISHQTMVVTVAQANRTWTHPDLGTCRGHVFGED